MIKSIIIISHCTIVLTLIPSALVLILVISLTHNYTCLLKDSFLDIEEADNDEQKEDEPNMYLHGSDSDHEY
jgi:hypothetical protein